MNPQQTITSSSVGQDNQSETILSQEKAITIGIVGIILPIGIQDFATKRTSWGIVHLLSLLLVPVGFFFWAFDGYCAGGKFCSSPPGALALLGSFVIGLAIALLVLNLFECIRLMSTCKIEFSKKSFQIIFYSSIVILTALLFAERIWEFYH